ncbi:tRNA (5-methylaminomethyl-2-thiouridine)(34)-methyltransferase MnmD [Bacteroidia bacterium]|nr:tRNA (5-methylaminomethyl-2-thiouridine)(34)-methyltransferase MnmD [Bacteroidia bacterium]
MELQQTTTGEFTLYIPSMDETYHSRNGAISEAKHVFIKEGMNRTQGNIRILEIGFGTGLNAMVTAQHAADTNRKVFYHTLEPFQVPYDLIQKIGYGAILEDESLFAEIHNAAWESAFKINEYFTLHKTTQKLEYVQLQDDAYDLIFFDAFAPKKQPELWNESIFKKLYKATRSNGVLTTYSAAGQLKRDLKSAGYTLEHPPGANGKREMTVALKQW